MKRADALRTIQYAGYHNDLDTAVRIYVEHRRVSYASYIAAWQRGVVAKRKGIRCGCPACTKEQESHAAQHNPTEDGEGA